MRFTRRASLALAAVFLGAVPATAAASPRIVGGHPAPSGPEYAAVGNVNIASALGCTGTLIDPTHVLSAGHCGSPTGEAGGSPVPFPPYSITVTLNSNQADGTGGTKYTVDTINLPPGYLATNAYDISIYHLTTAVPASVATPVKIAGKGFEALWKPNALETIAGFGTTSSGGSAPSTMLLAQVPIVTDAKCAAAYTGSATENPFDPKTEICASYPKGGTDTCQGDSGGPLFGYTSAGLRYLVGSTSYGQGCADAAYPGVYARDSDTTLLEYIRSVVPDAIHDRVGCEANAAYAIYDPAKNPSGPTGATGPDTPVGTAACPVSSTPPQGGTTTTPTGNAPSTTSTGATTTPATTSSTPPSTTSSDGTTTSTTTTPGGTVTSITLPDGTVTTTTTKTDAPPAPALAPAGGFTASVAVDRTLRKTVAKRGLRVRVRCSAACTTTSTVFVDAATAKALGLKSRAVGTMTVTFKRAGRTTRRVKLKQALSGQLLAHRAARYSLKTTITYAGGTRVLMRHVKLH